MAIPAIAAAAAASAISSGAQVYAQGKMNKKTREFSEHMYNRQRQDALDDWNRANQYNSPIEQMKRYKEAGLNPNLIYGQSNEAPAVRSTSAPDWNPQTPDFASLGQNVIGGIYEAQMKAAQLKLLESQNVKVEADTLYTNAKTYQENLRHDLDRETHQDQIDLIRQKLRGLTASIDISLSEEERRQAMHAPTLEKAMVDIANAKGFGEKIKSEIALQKNQNLLQELEIALRKKGLSYGDNVILRVLARVAEGESLSTLLKNLWHGLTK